MTDKHTARPDLDPTIKGSAPPQDFEESAGTVVHVRLFTDGPGLVRYADLLRHVTIGTQKIFVLIFHGLRSSAKKSTAEVGKRGR